MSLQYSQFVWGFEVVDSGGAGNGQNNKLDIRRVPSTGTNYPATLIAGVYTVDEFATEVARAMNAADGNGYAVSFNYSTLKFSITGTAAFELRVNDGTNAAIDCSGLLGLATTVNKTSSGSPQTIESDVAAGSTPTSTAGSWTLAEPLLYNSPVAAQTAGTAAAGVPRVAGTLQHMSDGGSVESIHFTTVKMVSIVFRALASGEQAKMEGFLNWASKGKRLTWQPDKTSANLLKLALASPGGIVPAYEWLARPEVGYGTLTFYEQLS